MSAKPDTKPQWQRDIGRVCAVIGDRLLDEIRQHDLVGAANLLYPNGQARTKNSHVLSTAAAVLHYAAENDLCSHLKVKKLKERKPVPRAVRHDDAEKLLDAAIGDLKFLLLFLFLQGWRISDALRLTWRDLNLDDGTVAYRITKTDDWLTVPLSDDMIEIFRAQPEGVGRIFAFGNPKAVYRALQPLCAATGVVFTPHQARHSFGTWLAAKGASMREIMEAGAWRDFRSVLRYSQVDIPRVRATMNRIKISAKIVQGG